MKAHVDSAEEGGTSGLAVRRMLAPTDLSAPGLKALDFCVGLRAPATRLVHVLEPFSVPPPEAPGSSDEQMAEYLRSLAARYEPAEVSPLVRFGDPTDEIVAEAREWRADLLVLSSRLRLGLAHLILGSVAERLLRRAACPLLVLHQYEHDFPQAELAPPEVRLRRILVTTDFKPDSVAAVRYAQKFAQQFGGKITLLHAVHLPGVNGWGDVPGADTSVTIATALKRAEAAMRQLRQEVGSEAIERHLVRVGAPVDVVPHEVVAGRFDLVVCATDSSAVWRHMFLGSTATRIVRHAYCPVLVVPSQMRREAHQHWRVVAEEEEAARDIRLSL